MTDETSDMQRSPALPRTTEQTGPDKTLTTGGILGAMTGFLRVGWGQAVVLRKSLRAGGANSATAVSLDGTDGSITADGTQGQLVAMSRSGNNKFSLWYHDGTSFYLYADDGPNIWAITTATGLITQPALSALANNANITVGIAGWQSPGTRLCKPDGLVYAILLFTVVGGPLTSYQVGAMNAAHAPSSGFIPLIWRKNGGTTPFTGYINSGGAIVFDGTLNVGDTIASVATYSQVQ